MVVFGTTLRALLIVVVVAVVGALSQEVLVAFAGNQRMVFHDWTIKLTSPQYRFWAYGLPFLFCAALVLERTRPKDGAGWWWLAAVCFVAMALFFHTYGTPSLGVYWADIRWLFAGSGAALRA